jgi:hypothetical protein
VDADLPLEPFQAARGVHHLLHVRLALVELAELDGLGKARVLRVEDAGQRDVLAHDGGRHRLGDPVTERERVAEHAGGVLDRRLGLDRRVGDDLRDALLAVALGGVTDHVAAPALVEVHVDVRHRHALGVQEPLEEQAVRDRVELGDAEGVGDQRARGRAPARTDPDALAFGIGDEVGHDQEVAGEAHLADDVELVLRLAAVAVRHAAGEPRGEAAVDLLAQPRLLGLALGHRELRHEVARGEDGRVVADPLGDRQRVVAGAGQPCVPELPHLLGGLQVEVAGVELQPLRVGERRAGLHAQQHLVRVSVAGERVVQVVGRDRRDSQPLAEAQQVLADAGLDGQAVVHDLEVEAVLAEDVAQLAGHPAGALEVADAQPGLHLAGRAAGGGDQALRVLLKELTVDAGLVEVALQAGPGVHPEEVDQAAGVRGQHREVRVCAAAGHVVLPAVGPAHPGALVSRGAGGHVELGADDRLDPGGLGVLEELVGPVHVPVVGDRQGRHPHARGLGEQRLQPGGSIEHRVLGVHVKVHEGVAHAALPAPVVDPAQVPGRTGRLAVAPPARRSEPSRNRRQLPAGSPGRRHQQVSRSQVA